MWQANLKQLFRLFPLIVIDRFVTIVVVIFEELSSALSREPAAGSFPDEEFCFAAFFTVLRRRIVVFNLFTKQPMLPPASNIDKVTNVQSDSRLIGQRRMNADFEPL